MDFRNFFNRNKGKDKNTVEAIVDDVVPEIDIYSDVPEVVFDTLELQVTIGQWLGILSSRQGISGAGLTISTHLDAEDLMRRLAIPSSDLELISKKFGLLLKAAGVDSSEVCALSNFDKKHFSCNCKFSNTDEDALLSITWGDWMDSGPELTIKSGNETRTYDYYDAYNERPAGLHLQHLSIKNPENGNSCFRFMSPYSSYFSLENGDYTFKIEIDRPKTTAADPLSGKDFKLNNEDELQQYLLGLTFPLDISEVYKMICKISVDSIYAFPSFNITVEKAEDKKTKKVTDKISLKNGQLEKFVLTKNGKTIAIDGDGNWSYGSESLNVSQNDGAVNYSLKSIKQSELSSLSSPLDQFNEVKQEVEGIKVYAKTMLTKSEE